MQNFEVPVLDHNPLIKGEIRDTRSAGTWLQMHIWLLVQSQWEIFSVPKLNHDLLRLRFRVLW